MPAHSSHGPRRPQQFFAPHSGRAGLDSFVITPANVGLVLAVFAPDVSIGQGGVTIGGIVGPTPVLITPGTATLVLTGFAPTVSVPRLVTPPVRALVLATFAPSVKTPRVVTPAVRALVLTGFASIVATPRLVTPTARALVLATFAPTVTVAGASVTVTPATAALVLTGFPPSIPGIATAPAGSNLGGGPLRVRVRALQRQPRPRARPVKPVPPRRKPVVFAVEVDDEDVWVALYANGTVDLEEFAALIAA